MVEALVGPLTKQRSPFRPSLAVLYAFLLAGLFALGTTTFVTHARAADELEPLPNPFHTEVLDDATFEGVVFPEGTPLDKQRPFLIMFYSPSCGHCRHILPIFNNASVQLYTDPTHPNRKVESARLAVVDAIKNTYLATQYKIKSFPTFFYTVNGRAHKYQGAQVLAAFMSTAVTVYEGYSARTFARDVTKPIDFKAAMNAEVPRRPWFVLCRPSRPPQGGPRDDANTFIESVVTMGKASFVQIYQDEAAPLSKRPATIEDESLRAYWAVRDACADAYTLKKDSLGPKGEALLLWSDRTARPLIYGGPQWGSESEVDGVAPLIASKNAPTFRTNRQLALWVWENGFNGVEKLSAESLAIVAKRARLGVLVLDSDVDFQMDTRFVPAILSLAQKRYSAFLEANPQADKGIVAHLSEQQRSSILDDFERTGQQVRMWLRTPTQFLIADGRRYKSWLEGLGVGTDKAPHFFVLDAMKETIWRMDEWAPKEKQAFLSKADAFAADGEEVTLMDAFLNDVEGVRGSAHLRGAATTSYGRIVSLIVDYVPFAHYLMSAVGDDDLKFVIVIAAVVGWSFVMWVAARKQPEGDEAVLSPLLGARKFV